MARIALQIDTKLLRLYQINIFGIIKDLYNSLVFQGTHGSGKIL